MPSSTSLTMTTSLLKMVTSHTDIDSSFVQVLTYRTIQKSLEPMNIRIVLNAWIRADTVVGCAKSAVLIVVG